MCGLVGMVTKSRNGFNDVNLSFFDGLLYMNALRGMDSTGVFVVNNIGNVKLAKDTMQAANFLNTKEYAELRRHANNCGWAMIGHGRKATKGAITDKNAHPFVVDEKLVLVHNGTIFGDHKNLKDVEVDSEAIAHALAESDNVEDALQQINGAYALIWYDVQKKKLNLIRNKERPLAWCETATAWYFASEAGMLDFVATRMGVQYVPKTFVNEFMVHTLDSWTLKDDRSSEIESVKLDANYTVQLKPIQQMGFVPSNPLPLTAEQQKQVDSAFKEWDKSRKIKLDADDEWPVVDNETGEIVYQDSADKAAEKRLNFLLATADTLKAQREGMFPVPPEWAHVHTYEEYMHLRSNVYAPNTRVKVEVVDKVEGVSDTNKFQVLMLGKSIDCPHEVFTVFPLDKAIYAAISDEDVMPAKTIFWVEASALGWRRNSDQLPDPPHNMAPWKGKCTLMGKNPKIHVHAGRVH